MSDKPHPVVKLLLARMESHPEEFRLKDPSYHDRWYNHMSAINMHGNEADKTALAGKIRDIRLSEIHEAVMDELLNGDDRRRKEEEEAEYERKTVAQQYMQQQQAQQNAMMSQYKNAYQSQLGQLSQYNQAQAVGLAGQGPISIANGGTSITGTTGILTNTINQLKEMLGAKK